MKNLRIPFYLGVIVCLLTAFYACSSDESKLEKKWQMRQVRMTDGSAEAVDSVYFSFMDGTFMLNCITSSGASDNLNGSYSFSNNTITMILTEGDANKLKDLIANNRQGAWRYLYWAEDADSFTATKEFQVTNLSTSSLHLVSGEYTYVYRGF